MCVDWNCIYWYMLLEFVIMNWDDDMVWIGELEMSIDNVLICELLLRNDELKVNMMNCLRIEWFVDNWLICDCCWECGMCWIEKWDENWDVELLMMEEWFDPLRLWI